ncbi:hypothetical protein [Virgibacillus sp. SK37]|uniref:hypothetical protein n=1 Tax=Virgibacillus sp. SK37 TaxID=403957 RepID=UPI00119D1809|nr:hypothetical protein [Virgibacillus sp. SK37]
MREVKNSYLFYCYSKSVANFIYERSNGDICPLTIAINPKSGNMFSLFSKSDKLQAILDQYKKESK